MEINVQINYEKLNDDDSITGDLHKVSCLITHQI